MSTLAASPSALVPIDEIARRFDISPRRVYAWIKAGKVPGAETSGRRVVVFRGPFEEAVSARTLVSRPDTAGIARGPRLLRSVESVSTTEVTTVDLAGALAALVSGRTVEIRIRLVE